MTQTTRFHPDRELKAAVRIAGLVVAGFAACFTVWSIAVPLAGAVVAPASVAVSGKAKAVQHKEGGVIAQIFVREGDRVTAGSMLMRLDDTQAKADFALLASQRWASTAREARLLAERSGAEDLILAAGQEDLRTDAAFQHVLQSERMMFVTRRTSRDGQKRQLTERAAQIEEQIQGSTRLLEARRKELVVLRAEHAELIPLRKVGLVNNMRFNTLERTLASVQGDEGNLTATIAASLAQMVEIRTQIANIDREHDGHVQRDRGTVAICQSRPDQSYCSLWRCRSEQRGCGSGTLWSGVE